MAPTLKLVVRVCAEAGYADAADAQLEGRALGVAVAEALIRFERGIGVPATLGEVPGFGEGHIERALTAARNPQLRMKLENMPVPLTADMVETYMAPVLRAATTGRLDVIRNVS